MFSSTPIAPPSVDERVSTVRQAVGTRNGSQSRSALALWTEVAGALHHPDGLDRRPAPPARQPFASIDLELGLVLAGLAEQIQVGLVVQRRPARLDRVLQDLLDRAVQPADQEILQDAIKARGTTLDDEAYLDLFGKPGEYQAELKVYGREGLPCRRCRTPIQTVRVMQRTS